MQSQEKQNFAHNYGQHKVHQMVNKRYKMLRSEGILQSLEDIYAKQPQSRIDKEHYSFTFDMLKNNIQQKMINRGKLQKILESQSNKLASIQVKAFKNVEYDNQANIYSQKLQSGLPIFKSIIYLRYQDNDKLKELLGQEHAFYSDQFNIDMPSIKADINKIKLFLQDDYYLTKLDFQFKSQNELRTKDDIFPFLQEVEKRSDVLAKLLLFNIFTEEHRKLKQAWKNDQDYQDMLKNEKKMKSQMQPQKTKEGDQQNEELKLKYQVKKVLENLQNRANSLAHDQFRQLNGQKAVQTKKSLQKLITLVQAQSNPRNQLKLLIAYKQKKTW